MLAPRLKRLTRTPSPPPVPGFWAWHRIAAVLADWARLLRTYLLADRQRGRDLPSPVTGLGALFRVGPIVRPILDLLDRTLDGALAGSQIGPCVAHDAKQPRPCLATTKGMEVTQCPEHRLLRYVLRQHRIAGQPACKSVHRIEMRKHQRAKSLERGRVRLRR